MTPGADPFDPLELALLMEVTEGLANLDREDPPGEGEQGLVARTMRSREMSMPRRYIKQVRRSYDRSGRRAASRISQRVVAVASGGPCEAAPLISPGPAGRNGPHS